MQDQYLYYRNTYLLDVRKANSSIIQWFAWTPKETIHWIVPILAGVPFGWACLLIFVRSLPPPPSASNNQLVINNNLLRRRIPICKRRLSRCREWDSSIYIWRHFSAFHGPDV